MCEKFSECLWNHSKVYFAEMGLVEMEHCK